MHVYIQEEGNAAPKTNSTGTPIRSLSGQARAQVILAADNISFDAKLHVFNVKGQSGVTRVVTLFPKQTCSCPSMGECYHITAAKLYMGMPIPVNKDTRMNLSKLRKNTRSRNDKRSGRKRPRPKDIECDGKYKIIR